MRFQKEPGHCGVTVIANALRCFGKKVSEKKIRALTNLDEEGVDEVGIKKALEELGFLGIEFTPGTKAAALLSLGNQFPSIICVDNWNHWVLLLGKVQDRYILIDSSRTVKNTSENGIHVVSEKELLKRWKNKGEAVPFFGIHVVSKQ